MLIKRYIVLRSYLTTEDKNELSNEVFGCHGTFSAANSFDHLDESTASLKLELGIKCGKSLEENLPLSVCLCRRAFERADQEIQDADLASFSSVDLTGLALLYGPKAAMSPHYDSPTQPGKLHEWLVMLTMGNTVEFICNDEVVTLKSGDAMVMDSMAVFHGVKRIVPDTNDDTLVLPVEGSRLGVLMWQAQNPGDAFVDDGPNVDGVSMLFPDDDD